MRFAPNFNDRLCRWKLCRNLCLIKERVVGSAGKTKAWWVVFGVGVGGYAKVKREGETLEGC